MCSVQACFSGNGLSRRRTYAKLYAIDGCPLNTELIYTWLVIDNATEADAGLTFMCGGGFIAQDGQYVNMSVKHSLIPSESIK